MIDEGRTYSRPLSTPSRAGFQSQSLVNKAYVDQVANGLDEHVYTGYFMHFMHQSTFRTRD